MSIQEIFTKEEKQYIITALDQEIRRTGLQTASFCLGIVAELQGQRDEALADDETQYVLNAINEEVKRTGLQTASFALGIVVKLQAEAQPAPPAEAEPQSEPVPEAVNDA